MIFKILIGLLLLPFILLALVVILFSIAPVRTFLFRLLGKQITQAARRGQMKVEVRTWNFGTSRDFDFQSKVDGHEQLGSLENSFGTVQKMKDVSPKPEPPSVL